MNEGHVVAAVDFTQPRPRLVDRRRMEGTDRRTMLLLAWTWPVPAIFDACPLRCALWCFALERAELHPDDVED